jgi:hypothetical protein
VTNSWLDNRTPVGRPQGSRWTREQIRAARLAPPLPLLQKRRLRLIELPADNFELAAYKGLLVKQSYCVGQSAIWLATPSTSSYGFLGLARVTWAGESATT